MQITVHLCFPVYEISDDMAHAVPGTRWRWQYKRTSRYQQTTASKSTRTGFVCTMSLGGPPANATHERRGTHPLLNNRKAVSRAALRRYISDAMPRRWGRDGTAMGPMGGAASDRQQTGRCKQADVDSQPRRSDADTDQSGHCALMSGSEA